MKVKIAKEAGFCFGVKRAMKMAWDELELNSDIYALGPLIHNKQAVQRYEDKGLVTVDTINDIPNDKSVIIRSHGVSSDIYDKANSNNLNIIDTTCPFVKKIHRLVQEYSDKGYLVIIIGSVDHPEVQGIVGWSHADRTVVINCESDVEKLDLNVWKKVCIVAQTTFNYNKFQELVEIIQKKGYYSVSTVDKDSEIIVHNTICSATKERQEAAKELSAKVDAMLVIGGLSSSNTRKLYEICSENCRNTYFIQTKEDLENSDFSRFDYVGITAGASTPNNIIEEVQKYVGNEF